MRKQLEVFGRKGCWWIKFEFEAAGETYPSMGPYDTRQEAERDARGVERTLQTLDTASRNN